MLVLLRNKFKDCQSRPKSDGECQEFKTKLCSAFPMFPCCADVRLNFLYLFLIFDMKIKLF